MAKITYITYDNKNHTVDVQNGLTVMEGAVQNDIPWNIILYCAFHDSQAILYIDSMIFVIVCNVSYFCH